MLPVEIELLLLAFDNVKKNLGDRDVDVPPYDNEIADAIEDMDVAIDQLRQMFEEPCSAYELGLDVEAKEEEEEVTL